MNKIFPILLFLISLISLSQDGATKATHPQQSAQLDQLFGSYGY